jgi:hypothetical protein
VIWRLLALVGFLTAACATLPPAIGPPPTPIVLAPPPVFDLVACRTPFTVISNYCDGPSGAVFTIAPIGVADHARIQGGDANGYTYVTAIPATWLDATLTITAPGYVTKTQAINLPALVAVNAKGLHNAFDLVLAHVDPSGFSLAQLAAIRGAMWPQTAGACGNLSIGPRPGDPTNIFATVFLSQYRPAEVDCMLSELHVVRGYTHAVAGPLVDSDGYHGVWTPHDWRTEWSVFLDQLQRLWDAGLAPVVFIHPDGWTFEQTRDELTPLLLQPRAQRLIRIAVGSGWEPAGYNWSSCTWARYAQWVRETLPNALSLIHNAVKEDGSPYDAPVGTDARCDDNGHPNGEGWARVAPYLHGFLIQFGPYNGTPTSLPDAARGFAGQFMADGLGADEHGFNWHFVHGISGWPTGSAWSQNQPILLYGAEMTAYLRFWRGMSEADGNTWGDLAIASGAAGYLDGGTVAVPVR